MDRSIESLTGSPPSLFLMGMRGAGKTTLGKLAAEHLRIPFVDADDLFCERHAPHSAKTFVAEHGWPAFRAEETKLLMEILDKIRKQGKPMVVSLGGGVVEEEVNRKLLRNSWSDEDSGQFDRKKRIAVVHIFREVDNVLLDARGLPSWGVTNGHEVWERRRPWFRESCKYTILLRRQE
jgi:pentafunctional AROM polypeptide